MIYLREISDKKYQNKNCLVYYTITARGLSLEEGSFPDGSSRGITTAS